MKKTLLFFSSVIRILFVFLFLVPINFITANENFDKSQDKRLDVLQKMPFIIVPLGGSCEILEQLRFHNLYLASFPIDWMVTHHIPSLLALIENDFEDLVDFSKLQIKFERGTNRVLHNKYQIELPHILDISKWHNSKLGLVPNSGKTSEIDLIVIKYRRRIERFKQVVRLGKPIMFLRFNVITENEARMLYEVLKKKFPFCNFKLICLFTSKISQPWEKHDFIIPEYVDREYDRLHKVNGYCLQSYTQFFSRIGWIEAYKRAFEPISSSDF